MKFDSIILSLVADDPRAFILLGLAGALMALAHAFIEGKKSALYRSLKKYGFRSRLILITAYLACGSLMGLVAGLTVDPSVKAKALFIVFSGGAWAGILSLRSRVVGAFRKLYKP